MHNYDSIYYENYERFGFIKFIKYLEVKSVYNDTFNDKTIECYYPSAPMEYLFNEFLTYINQLVTEYVARQPKSFLILNIHNYFFNQAIEKVLTSS